MGLKLNLKRVRIGWVNVFEKAQDTTAPDGKPIKGKFQLTAYLDKDDNGKFDVDYTNSGVTNARDLVSYSYYKDKNSAGKSASGDCGVGLPSFKIDDDMKPGIYRMRYKVDWDNVDPGGSTATGNLITGNGGALIDVLVNIHNDEVNLFRATEENGGGLNGDVLLADGKQLTGRTTPFGQAFVIKSKPAEGFVLEILSNGKPVPEGVLDQVFIHVEVSHFAAA